jgi:hypothetical protein
VQLSARDDESAALMKSQDRGPSLQDSTDQGSQRARAPGKQTLAQVDAPGSGLGSEGSFARRPSSARGSGDGAGDWLADEGLMSAMGLGSEIPLILDLQASSSESSEAAPARSSEAAPASSSAAAPAETESPSTPPQPPARRRSPKRNYIPFTVPIPGPMTGEEFKAAACLQAFGSATAPIAWHNIKDSYSPDTSPVTVMFEASLVRLVRGDVNAARGIETDAGGAVTGADHRAKDFQSQPASDEKAAILAEIDRRYYSSNGASVGTKIQAGDAGRSTLWRTVRDEVLFQHERLANLPAKVRALIQQNVKGRDLTPADYDQLFQIVRKINRLPPGAVADYASKITGSTPDLSVFEAKLDDYRDELAARQEADTERTEVQNKLLGLDEVYKLYRQYTLRAGLEAASPSARQTTQLAQQLGSRAQTADDLRDQLEQQLPRHGFASIAEFASYLSRFEQAFEDGAARIALDLLDKYAGKLSREAQRYQDPAVVAELYGKLAPFRAQHDEFVDAASSSNAHAKEDARSDELARMPGNGHLRARPQAPERAQAGKRAEAAKARAAASIKDLASEYPIFAEDDLPVDKRLDKAALAQASEGQLAGVLQAHLADRLGVVAKARGQLEGKHPLIYKMDKLMPAFYAQMGLQPGSIHDQIIQDKLHDDAIAKLVGGLTLAIVAVALTVVSLGAATPALVAAGASISAAGLSTYLAYDEYQHYAEEHALSEAGFADDPSMLWLVLAIVGAGVDMAAATKAVRALAPAAKALDGGGEVADFSKAVEALQKSKQLDDKIAVAADNAAKARKAYAAAKGDLTLALGRAYSFPGPFTDPDVYRALVKMAVAKIKEGSHSLVAFLDELKQARLAAKLGDLTPEELVKVKEAFAQAESLARLVPDAAMLEKLLAKIGDASQLERLLQVFPAAELENLVDVLGDAKKLVVMLDHLGKENTGRITRQWIEEGQIAKANHFLERLSAGVGKELAETAKVGARSIILDSNTVIALMKDADPAMKMKMNSGEIARVAYVNNLPPGTELRIGNVAVGEAGGRLNLRGVPTDVLRDSPEYTKILNHLAENNVGRAGGFADQALVADAFFARTEAGANPRLITSDAKIVNALARIAGIDANRVGGFNEIVRRYGSTGFNVTIEKRTLTIIPVP